MFDIEEIYYIKKDETEKYTSKLFDAESVLYINEEKAFEGVDYNIDEDGGILFPNKLNIGDILYMKHRPKEDVEKVFTKSPYNNKAIFHAFSKDTNLKFNHKYVMECYVRDIDNEDDNNYLKFTNTFVAKYNPYYSSVKKIRSDTGTLLGEVEDDVIARLIYSNSKEANEIAADGTFDDGVPGYAKNYVRYKTDIDICVAVYLSICGIAGERAKTLSDIKIERNVKIPYLEDMLKRFRELLKPNEDALIGPKVVASSFVKAKKYPYPINEARLFNR